ncbi:uncharacterized protein LOC105210064 [Zeugodacus cucurbitae]|uniref:uncharacterized protein LOC105210064 n=1 Tax=Zeugodacus cucurbitae TaxID=28588 RepID=UPI0023D90AAE|nr:uncharacterized protein LOC105210064 [Zeugodacus cucurbitae]
MRDNGGRLWGKFYNDEFEVRSLTKADLPQALEVLDKSFFLCESACIGSEVNLPENAQARGELRELCRIAADDGVSLVAKHVESGKIVGVSFNKIQPLPPAGEELFFINFRNEQAKSPQAKRLMDFMIDINSARDVYKLYNIDTVLELMFLSTLQDWGKRGIATELVRYTVELTRELSQGIGIDEVHPALRALRPKAVTAIYTSKFSQKAGRTTGFTVINTVPYTKMSYNGKTFDQRVNPIHQYAEHVIFLL